MSLIQETIVHLLASEIFAKTELETVVVSPVFTGVRLDNGMVGMARTEDENKPFLRCDSAILPGQWKGMKVSEVLQLEHHSGYSASIQLAVINAVSALHTQISSHRIIEDCDPFDMISLSTNKNICLVGAFHSYIQKSLKKGFPLKVLELDPDVFTEETKHLYIPAQQYAEVFAQSDIIIITGSSIANNTIDDLLQAVPKTAQAILCGPSAGLLPEILFSNGVSIIGTTQILDSEKAMSIIAEGGAAYHLFRCGAARKICILP